MIIVNVFSLQRFKDNGVLTRLRNTYLVTRESTENGFPVVTLGRISPILTVFVGGVLLGCIVLMLEKIYCKICDSKCKGAFECVFSRKIFNREFATNYREEGRQVKNVTQK